MWWKSRLSTKNHQAKSGGAKRTFRCASLQRCSSNSLLSRDREKRLDTHVLSALSSVNSPSHSLRVLQRRKPIPSNLQQSENYEECNSCTGEDACHVAGTSPSSMKLTLYRGMPESYGRFFHLEHESLLQELLRSCQRNCSWLI